jgi:hypothetical protein
MFLKNVGEPQKMRVDKLVDKNNSRKDTKGHDIKISFNWLIRQASVLVVKISRHSGRAPLYLDVL